MDSAPAECQALLWAVVILGSDQGQAAAPWDVASLQGLGSISASILRCSDQTFC